MTRRQQRRGFYPVTSRLGALNHLRHPHQARAAVEEHQSSGRVEQSRVAYGRAWQQLVAKQAALEEAQLATCGEPDGAVLRLHGDALACTGKCLGWLRC